MIDDLAGHTLAASATNAEELEEELSDMTRSEGARRVGEHLARLAAEKGINKAVFDRSGYKFHGVIKELAEGAREAGLDF